ncbi:MAG: heavy-metal-associated domain-containing protein [Thiohalospira sp.]
MAGTTLKVTGMTCGHCVNAVKEALEEVEGVESAEVSLEEGKAEVTGTADPSALLKAVAEEGYQAEVA